MEDSRALQNKMITSFIVIFLLSGFSGLRAADIQCRTESGKKIYYNIQSTTIVKQQNQSTKPSRALQVHDYDDLIADVARRHDIDPDLIRAVIHVESGYNSRAVSRAGALGLMQLMPQTGKRFGVTQFFDPSENIEGGVRYLKFLLDLFQNDLSLVIAAYNAGENAVKRFGGIPRYPETQNYVRNVLALYGKDQSPRSLTYYKFVDEKGITHYSSTPHPGAVAIQIASDSSQSH